jgi:hypothetical protein
VPNPPQNPDDRQPPDERSRYPLREPRRVQPARTPPQTPEMASTSEAAPTPDDSPPPDGKTRRRRPNATPEQLAARQQDADARQRTAARKKRTRELIRVGGVFSAWGIDTPEQAEELMRRLTSADHKEWRRYLLGALKVRRTDRWPER